MKREIAVWDISGNKDQDVISFDFDNKECDSKAYSCAIRKLLQNWRQGTVGCKGRGEVSFSNRKPWRQKGTGRARAGSLRSPLWRKGGVVFGPQPRTRKLSLNSKQLKSVFGGLFNNFLKDDNNKNIYCLNFDLSKDKPSTKKASSALKGLGINDKKVVVFLPFGDDAHFASFRNIPNVTLLNFDQPNAFHLGKSDCWVFLKKDVDSFKSMVSLWN